MDDASANEWVEHDDVDNTDELGSVNAMHTPLHLTREHREGSYPGLQQIHSQK